MFRKMRRNAQELSFEESAAILENQTNGILSLIGDEGYPYGVPISYAYDRAAGKIYMHCAKEGHKLDALTSNSKASFTVVGQDEIHGDLYTTFFKSVICFGKVRVIAAEDPEFKDSHLMLCEKYSAMMPMEKNLAALAEEGPRMHMLAFDIEHMTGKQCRELMKK